MIPYHKVKQFNDEYSTNVSTQYQHSVNRRTEGIVVAISRAVHADAR